MMPSSVLHLAEFDTSIINIISPEKTDNKMRISNVICPLLQTSNLTYTYDGSDITVLCSDEHANKIHDIDDLICSTVANESQTWFGQILSHDQVERMYCPTLQGSRNPRQTLDARLLKSFDNDMQATDSLPASGSAMFILKLNKVVFKEKLCQASWSVVQAKEYVQEVSDESTLHDEQQEPLFLS